MTLIEQAEAMAARLEAWSPLVSSGYEVHIRLTLPRWKECVSRPAPSSAAWLLNCGGRGRPNYTRQSITMATTLIWSQRF
jgi:hypothetical protein